jgi:SAM-dependent methyltransferase
MNKTESGENYDLVPPETLIQENKIGIGDYQAISEEFCKVGKGITENMMRMGLLSPSSIVLDVGCGLGRLARPLVSYLEDGEYYGIDTTKSSVAWCAEAYKEYPNFHFMHSDVYSTTYNRTATTKARDYIFPFNDGIFDFVWSTSLFTHMVIADVDNYLKEMSRVMKNGAMCWNTFLILDDVALALLDDLNARKTRYCLPYDIDGGRVRDQSDPEAQIALYEDRIIEIYRKHGLGNMDIRYGPWSGRTENVKAGGQDVIVAQKRYVSFFHRLFRNAGGHNKMV